MNEDIKKFIESNRICVVSILRPDGSVHAATVHYSSNTERTEFYIATSRKSRKAERLLSGEAVKASMVIGFNEELMITLQMDGEVIAITEEAEVAPIKEIHYAMHPFAKKFENDPNTLFLKFETNWWRYSEFKSQPPVFIESINS